MKDDCIFCKLANGIIPTSTVYEDENFRAILDIEPAASGHVLILPKQHTENLLAMEDELAAKALPTAKKIATAMKKALSCDGINLLQNTGTAAWQSVFHFHIHLIPRYTDDNLSIPWKKSSYADGKAASIAKKIAAQL